MSHFQSFPLSIFLGCITDVIGLRASDPTVYAGGTIRGSRIANIITLDVGGENISDISSCSFVNQVFMCSSCIAVDTFDSALLTPPH